MKKVQRPIADIVRDFQLHYEAAGMSQTAYSIASGVRQWTISRLLAPNYRRKRLSKELIKLCKYANIKIYSQQAVDPRSSKALMDALESVWDGSDQHSKALARCIRDLGRLR